MLVMKRGPIAQLRKVPGLPIERNMYRQRDASFPHIRCRSGVRLFQYFIAYRYLSDVMECAGKITFSGRLSSSNPINRPDIPHRRPHPENVVLVKGDLLVYNFSRRIFARAFTCAKIKLLLGTRHFAPQALLQPPAAKRAKNAVLKKRAKKRVRAFLIHDPAAYPSKETRSHAPTHPA